MSFFVEPRADLSMQKEVHVITCGASLLRNFARNLTQSSLLCKYPDLKEKLEDPNVSEGFLKSLSGDEKIALKGEMLKYLERNPKAASAELNSLLSYVEQVKGTSKLEEVVSEVHIFRSDTEAGKIVADVLQDYLHSLGANVSIHTVAGFGTGDFSSAVKNLVRSARDVVRRNKNVVLNLTAGFKAETAAMAVLASESDLDQYYIHESSKKVVMLPKASELKVRMTKWEKVAGVLAVLLNIPFSLNVAEISLKLMITGALIWILWKKA